jgi:Holliday junction resolvase RusA-like endonuclease
MGKLRMAKMALPDPPPLATGSDIDEALMRLRALAPVTSMVDRLTFVHEGNPIPKGRARFGNGHAFTPARTVHAEGALVRAFRDAWQRRPMLTDTLALVVLFYVPTRQRKDLDNLSKLVMDAATKARIWQDDSQVKAKTVVMELDALRPRTVIALCPYLGSLTRTPLLVTMGDDE